jgi:hypothetical protein
LYLGTNGTVSSGCNQSVVGGGGSGKTLYGAIINDNFAYKPGNSAFQLGGGKGACDTTMNNNLWISGAEPGVIAAQFGFWHMDGNIFMFGNPTELPHPPYPQGGPSHFFTLGEYGPSGTTGHNTFLASIPTTNLAGACVGGGTPPCKMYRINAYEAGRGHVAVFNPTGTSTVSNIDLCSMGGFVGEKWRVYNAQDADPWQSTPLMTWDTTDHAGISSCPKNVTLPTTLSSALIHQPSGVGNDLVTPFPKPPDLGPIAVTYILYPDWNAVAGTATPTFTSTSTSTPTRTPSTTPSITPSLTPTFTATRTPTFTPSITPSASVTPSNTPSASATPTRTNTATFTPSATLTPTSTPTRTATPSGGGGGSSIDVGNCTVAAPMVLSSDLTTFPFHFVTSPTTNQGLVTCQFTILSSGTYYVYTKVYTGVDATHDSLFFDLCDAAGLNCQSGDTKCATDGDTTCSAIYDTASDKDPNSFTPCTLTRIWDVITWKQMNLRNFAGGSCTGEGARYSTFLNPGQYTIKFRMRDPDSRLYYIILNTDPDFTPVEPQPTPTPIPAGSGCFRYCRCHGREKPIPVSCSLPKFGPCVPCPW